MINRREFLSMSSGLLSWSVFHKLFPQTPLNATPNNRLSIWEPDVNLPIEWRYLAGRVTQLTEDYGFILSISDVSVNGLRQYRLILNYQDFLSDNQYFVDAPGNLTYDTSSGTYRFEDEMQREMVVWQWDNTLEVYTLSIDTDLFILQNAILRPKGPIIAEGGDGHISVGKILGIEVSSIYHADWVSIELANQPVGIARIDIQGLKRTPGRRDSRLVTIPWRGSPHGPRREPYQINDTADTYDHHWFVFALELVDGTEAWVSIWRIEDENTALWCVTVATGSSTTWQITSRTEEDEDIVISPLQIQTLMKQSITELEGLENSTHHAGSKWRITVELDQPIGHIDLTFAIPEGQFLTGSVQTGAEWVVEGTGIDVSGIVMNKAVRSVRMAAAESSTELFSSYLPAINID